MFGGEGKILGVAKLEDLLGGLGGIGVFAVLSVVSDCTGGRTLHQMAYGSDSKLLCI